jgi:hypothetical protein
VPQTALAIAQDLALLVPERGSLRINRQEIGRAAPLLAIAAVAGDGGERIRVVAVADRTAQAAAEVGRRGNGREAHGRDASLRARAQKAIPQ